MEKAYFAGESISFFYLGHKINQESKSGCDFEKTKVIFQLKNWMKGKQNAKKVFCKCLKLLATFLFKSSKVAKM